ncbi:DUF3102 domain-containing protein [Clostridium tagluense]|uniref:DUF3102 domain-containing protein n=1 Tax=Clostridium tagluense TaxID=360422 RepID=A0A401UUD1_9CLOT|nr:DUF3102 domain-containing protein [Clostridium tagluense]GCD13179.1 hypothetical protein Ctaglu_48020 [Clostridium tagluense]
MDEIQNIDTLTTEILILKQQTAQNIIEIGKRLVAVKESLPHGQWGKWLAEKVDFSNVTASRFMRVANEFSNISALKDLGSSKIFALLDVPEEQREEFVSAPHEVNGEIKTVDEMTTRELQKTIKERDEFKKIANEKSEEARKAFDEKVKAEAERRTTDAVLREAQKDVKNLQDTLRKQKEKSEKDIADLQSFIGEAESTGDNEEVLRLQASLQELQNDVDSSALKIDELEAELKAKPIDVITAEPVIIEKVPEEIEKELQELRKKDSQNSDQSVVKFKRYYENLQSTFTAQLELIDEMKDTNPQNHEKFKNAISKLLSKMTERL